MRRVWPLLLPAALAGCVGTVRETTSPRTATEMLLISTAAQRAVLHYEPGRVEGRRVFVDASNFDSIDKGFVVSAMRDHLAGYGAILVDVIAGTAERPGAEVVVELRNGALGIYDGEFTLGLPQLPVSAPGFTTSFLLPPLYLFRRDTSQGWAKLQVWTWDPRTGKYVSRSPDLWGSAYYNQWSVFGIGPFDSSNDIYPGWDMDRFQHEGEGQRAPPAPAYEPPRTEGVRDEEPQGR